MLCGNKTLVNADTAKHAFFCCVFLPAVLVLRGLFIRISSVHEAHYDICLCNITIFTFIQYFYYFDAYTDENLPLGTIYILYILLRITQAPLTTAEMEAKPHRVILVKSDPTYRLALTERNIKAQLLSIITNSPFTMGQWGDDGGKTPLFLAALNVVLAALFF